MSYESAINSHSTPAADAEVRRAQMLAVIRTLDFARVRELSERFGISAVTVRDFLKSAGIGYLDSRGYDQLSGHTATLADYEGFPSHALAIRERARIWKKNGRP